MLDDRILFVLDADTTAYDSKLSKAAQRVIDLKGEERAAHLKELGIIQRLKVETELYQRVRAKANNPDDIKYYTERVKELTGQMRTLTGAMQPKGTSIFDSLKSGLGIGAGFSLVQGLQRGAALLLELGKNSLTAASNAEETTIAFQTMLQSKDAATKLQAQIIDLAAKTPFELTDLNDYTKRLLAMGIETEKVIDDTKALGDIAAGVGRDKLPQMVLAFGQVKTAAKLMGGELRQFQEAGVPLLEELAKQSGKTNAQVRKDIEDGKVKFSQVRDAIRGLTSENGKFFNLMEKQSSTLAGMTSNLSDAWTQLEVVMGQKFTGAAKKVVGMLTDITSAAKKFLEVPMSEKLEEERSALNGLVSTAIGLNDNYEARAALIREIKAEYPDFLRGIDAETVSNEQLIARLKEVNSLYEKRIQLEVAKEKEGKLATKQVEYDKKAVQDQQKALEMLDKALRKQGKSFDTEGFNNAKDKQDFIETALEQAGTMMQGNIKFILNNAAKSNIGGSKYNKDLQAAVLNRINLEKQANDAELDDKRKGLERAKMDVETAKKERDRFSKDSEEYRYYNGIVSRQESSTAKLKIEYAKAEIERIDKEISTTTSKLNGLDTAFNDATLNGKNTAQIKLDMGSARARLSALAKERSKFEKDLPVVDESDPKTEDKAKKAREKAQREAEQLAEKRIKAKEDLAKKLAQLNADIGAMEQKDGIQTVERIKKRYELEAKADLEGLKKQKEDLIRSKVFSRKEANTLFAPVEAATQQKQNLAAIIAIKQFQKEAREAQAQNQKAIDELMLDASKERLDLLLDSLQKQNKAISLSFEDDKRTIQDKFNNIRRALRSDYEKGLLSIADTDKAALDQAGETFKANLEKLNSLELDALERAREKRDAALLELNRRALQEAQQANQDLFSTFERGRSEAETLEIQNETEKYIRKQINYEQFQKGLTAIQNKYELARAKSRVTEIEESIREIEKRYNGLNANDQADANREVERLKTQLAQANAKVAELQAGERTTTDSDFNSKFSKYLDGYQAISEAAINAFRTIEDAELSYLNRSIDAQSKRIDQAKSLRDKGNVEYLAEEEKRMTILEERRRRALARQQFLDRLAQLSAVSVGVARAFAESGGKFTAITLAASISALVAAYSLVNTIVPNTQRFAKGTKYVKRPNGVPKGTDTVPALLTEGERVTDERANRDYGASFDLLESRKITPKEAYKRLKGENIRMNVKRLGVANDVATAEKVSRIETERLLKKQISQNDELIGLLRGKGSEVSINLDRKGFALSVSEAAVRENKRTS